MQLSKNVPNRYKPTLKETTRLWRRSLYNKIENIFVWENLPKEIPVRLFNLMLWRTGKVVFYKIGDKYLVQPFAYNDILDWYYVPAKGRVVNPYLPKGHQNWEFKVADEAVIYNSTADIYNFTMYSVSADLIYKTANQLSENDISLYCITRNARMIAILSAETDIQKRGMDKVIEKMMNGDTDITMEENMVSHIRANPLTQNSTRNTLTEIIESTQYILANFYHSFGINSNYNLKREQLNSDEIDVNQEVLRLNIEDLLKSREDGVEKINEKYGLDIKVSLNEKLYATLLQLANTLEMNQNGTFSNNQNSPNSSNTQFSTNEQLTQTEIETNVLKHKTSSNSETSNSNTPNPETSNSETKKEDETNATKESGNNGSPDKNSDRDSDRNSDSSEHNGTDNRNENAGVNNSTSDNESGTTNTNNNGDKSDRADNSENNKGKNEGNTSGNGSSEQAEPSAEKESNMEKSGGDRPDKTDGNDSNISVQIVINSPDNVDIKEGKENE